MTSHENSSHDRSGKEDFWGTTQAQDYMPAPAYSDDQTAQAPKSVWDVAPEETYQPAGYTGRLADTTERSSDTRGSGIVTPKIGSAADTLMRLAS